MITACILCMTACNKSNVTSPDNKNIWGFGNKKEDKTNTFESNTAGIADITTYTYLDANEFSERVKNAMYGQYQGIYQTGYQEAVNQTIDQLKQERIYSIDHPLMIGNPFGTNERSLYIYMGNDAQNISVHYTIAAQDTSIPDFSGSMYINRTTSTQMEGQIIGLLAGQQNKVVIDILDANGGKITKKAYLISMPESMEPTIPNLTVTYAVKEEFTRGLFHFIIWGDDISYYTFYDNNGVLRSVIPTFVTAKQSKVLPVGNHMLVEYTNNMFVLMNNLGGVENFYSLENGDQVVDYDYDATNDSVLMIVRSIDSRNADRIMRLNLANGNWSLHTDFTKIIKDYETAFSVAPDEQRDWIDLKTIQCTEGKDYIVLSRALSSIIRVNNAYASPVVRWVIGPETKWRDTSLESALLYQTGEARSIGMFDSMTYQYSKKLKQGTFYINVIQRDVVGDNPKFHQFLINELQDRYRTVQTIPFATNQAESSAITYGKHVVLRLGAESELQEYNEKGEIMLRIQIPNMNFSYQIYKYTMDRYWF